MWELFIKTFRTLNYKPILIKNKNDEILNTGNAFSKSCEILGYKFYHDKKTMPIVPMITNMAFACELYLKYILEINGIEQPKGNNGHDFNILINKLPELYKQDLILRISNVYDQISIDNFDNRIEPIKKCFSSWRYIHEAIFEKEIDLELLTKFMHCLQQICNEESEKRRPTTAST